MIAWRWVLLLERVLVLLVNDDESQFLERQEDGTSRSQDYIIGMTRKLLLPDFHTLRITVFRMEYAEPVAKHLVQSLHNLNGEGDFGQQIKHLLMFLDGFSDKMDVDFSLSTRSHTMQKYHVLIHHLQEYLIVGILLGFGKRFDEFEMRFARSVQSAHLQFIGKENTPVDECLDGCSRASCLVHQFLLGHLLDAFPGRITLQTVPVGKGKEGG